MNVASVSSASASTATRYAKPSSPPEDPFADALTSAGVDDSQLGDLLSQIQSAIASAQSASGGSADSSQSGSVDIREVVHGVLEANGVDVDAFDEAMEANGPPPGPPPNGAALGPPPGPPPTGGEGSFASALSAAGVDDESISDLLDQIQEAIQSSLSSDTNEDSTDPIKSAITSVLQSNGVNISAFESALQSQFGQTGTLLDTYG